MSLARLEPTQKDLALEAGITTASHPHGLGAVTIVIHLGPGKSPEWILLDRSRWKTVTALNYAQRGEFHMRLRTNGQHFIVYGSHSRVPNHCEQRGYICRSMADVERAIPLLRKELGLEKPGLIGPWS